MIPFPNKQYQIIYADPPWQQTKGGLRKVRPNQERTLDYPTLKMQDISNILLAVPKSEDHCLFIWTIDKFLFDTETLCRDMGYRLHARLIWDKGNGIAPAFTIRYSHEYLIWFYKLELLSIVKEQRGKWTTVLREPSVRHSQKPNIGYRLIESLYPEFNKIELFARQKREGWDVWGDEI